MEHGAMFTVWICMGRLSDRNPRSNPRSCWSGRGELAYSCETTALGEGVRVLWTLPTPIGSHNSQWLALQGTYTTHIHRDGSQCYADTVW